MKPITPIFPLELVVYPGEALNLHIFEPRYRELIQDCRETRLPFGIPPVVNKATGDFGTLVELLEITRVHPGGEMDIKTRGLKVFRITELVKRVPGRLYSGAVVEFPENQLAGDAEAMRQVLSSMRQLLKILNVDKQFTRPEASLVSYDLAHHVGLSAGEEYQLLGILDELERQAYLNRHLAKILPTVMEIESLKEKVRLNGHFKALPGVEF